MRQRYLRLHTLAGLILAVIPLMIGLASPAAAEGEWDPTLPEIISAGAPGDPVAVANASLNATAQATQTTLDLGRKFLSGFGINLGGAAPVRRWGCPIRGGAARWTAPVKVSATGPARWVSTARV
jgi:hypothetical protein